MSAVSRQRPRESSRSSILQKADFFASIGLWPATSTFDPRGWLKNFRAEEERHALCCLNAFIFVSAEITDALLVSAFHNLSAHKQLIERHGSQHRDQWRAFRDKLVATYVEARNPNASESGPHFARLARHKLDLPQSQIFTPEAALRVMAVEPDRPVLLLDDFIGSGDQVTSAWTHHRDVWPGETSTYRDVVAQHNSTIVYCPLVSTFEGSEVVRRECPSLLLMPAHELDARENFVHEDSLFWPPGMRDSGIEFIRAASARAGIPDSECFGYKGQALALAFEHGVPDATLPIFWHESENWQPLIRRR
ncbi:hypothetical protein SAMN05428982_0522 [Pseudoxanthomonas sp. CF385]|uniref:phosphoribosyltransferase-like protein n=1 Tax=Pseudoxanthomonas sp. CF385 TaxID=1881042 RepID=UPI00088E35B9|nr:hypothetical protein [Pseudoxanthomonas sp. CF385]SDQ29846.1 hypothetical protein SAMN05428982_0522 [Pseudoxanthomonas sp. CF385]